MNCVKNKSYLIRRLFIILFSTLVILSFNESFAQDFELSGVWEGKAIPNDFPEFLEGKNVFFEFAPDADGNIQITVIANIPNGPDAISLVDGEVIHCTGLTIQGKSPSGGIGETPCDLDVNKKTFSCESSIILPGTSNVPLGIINGEIISPTEAKGEAVKGMVFPLVDEDGNQTGKVVIGEEACKWTWTATCIAGCASVLHPLTLTEEFQNPTDKIEDPPDLNQPPGADRSLTVNRIKLMNNSDDTDIMISALVYSFIGTDREADDFLEMDVNALLFEDLDCDGIVVVDNLINQPTPIKGAELFGFILADKVIKPGKEACFALQYDISQENPLCKKFGARLEPGAIIATFIDPSTNEKIQINDISGPIVDGTIVIRNEDEECLFIVNDDTDSGNKGDINNGDGICDTGETVRLINGEVVPECTFIAAIQEANAFPGKDKISFLDLVIDSITIVDSDPLLPDITDPVIIDGSTLPNGIVLLEIIQDKGLVITGGDSTVKGINITSFDHGIVLKGKGDNVIQGNFIGSVFNSDSFLLKNGIFIDDSANNKIGGTSDAERNVIAGSDENGIEIKGINSKNNIVSGNFIGTGLGGKENEVSFMNEKAGVFINNAPDNIIKNNVIGNSRFAGVNITGIDATGNKIQGNIMGTSVDFAKESLFPDLSNILWGVLIDDNASNNTIGGEVKEEGNFIFFSGSAGVAVASGTGNTIRLNSIFFNVDTDIDLGADGPTENDEGDFDSGPNLLMNFPVLESAEYSGGLITIKGTLDNDKLVEIILDFYLANSKTTRQGMHIGATPVNQSTPDSPESFEVTLPLDENRLDKEDRNLILSTATDTDGNTSEYSDFDSNPVEIETLQDTDGDGVGDIIEDGGPNNGDGNNDGIPDSVQATVVTFKNIENNFVNIEAAEALPDTVLRRVMIVEIPSPESVPQSVEIDSGGCFEFTIDGSIAEKINLRLQELTETNILYNLGKTPDNPEDHWYEFDFDGSTGAEILEEENSDSISFTIQYVDGQRGDDDLEENGETTTLVCPAIKEETNVTPGDETSEMAKQLINDIENVREKENNAEVAVEAGDNADAINLLNESQEDLTEIISELKSLKGNSNTSKEKRAADRAVLAMRRAIALDGFAVNALNKGRPTESVRENIEKADLKKEQAISILKEGFGVE